MCRDQDAEKLHETLKFKTKGKFRVEPAHNKLKDIYRYDPPPPEPTAAEKEEAVQQHYRDLASTFRNEKEGGRLMTRKSMQELLEKLTEE